jgi:hypothetical protein
MRSFVVSASFTWLRLIERWQKCGACFALVAA